MSKQKFQQNRFEFGKNWNGFLALLLSEDRILEAEKSLRQMLETEDLSEKEIS